MSASNPQAALSAALDRMWAQYLPLMHERVSILDAAAQAFAADQLSAEQNGTAQAAAHKLAGVLGTFGLTRGTVLARELEVIYSRKNSPDPALAERMRSIAVELRTIIETRK
jgi:HPt (histidine-containing phosphotransfer) domain-containing protein